MILNIDLVKFLPQKTTEGLFHAYLSVYNHLGVLGLTPGRCSCLRTQPHFHLSVLLFAIYDLLSIDDKPENSTDNISYI